MTSERDESRPSGGGDRPPEDGSRPPRSGDPSPPEDEAPGPVDGKPPAEAGGASDSGAGAGAPAGAQGPGDVSGRLYPPLIAMIVYAALGLVFRALMLAGALTGDSVEVEMRHRRELPAIAPEASLTPFIVWFVLGLVMAGGIIFAAVQARRLRMYPLAVTAAIVCMVPCLNPCCFVIGLVPGIWTLVILLQPDIKAAFEQAAQPQPE